MKKFNIIVESHESQIKAKEKAEDCLKKLENHMLKLNNERHAVINSIIKYQTRLDDNESEIKSIKEEIHIMTSKITTACIDGNMDQYSKITNEIKICIDKLSALNKKKYAINTEKEKHENDKEIVDKRIGRCQLIINDITDLYEKTIKVENIDKNLNDSQAVNNYIKEINVSLEGLTNIGAITITEPE